MTNLKVYSRLTPKNMIFVSEIRLFNIKTKVTKVKFIFTVALKSAASIEIVLVANAIAIKNVLINKIPDRMTVGQDVGDKENHSKMVQQLSDGSMVEVRVDKVTEFCVLDEMV